MKIGLTHSRTVWRSVAARCASQFFAEVLAESHQVNILHHGVDVTADRIAEFTGTNLCGVTLKHIAPLSLGASDLYNPLRRYWDERNATRSLSAEH